MPRGSAQDSYWDDDWLRFKNPGVYFNKAVIAKSSSATAKFRMRWGNEDSANPARLNLFVCDNNGCTGNRLIAGDDRLGAAIKVGEWRASATGETEVHLRVCRDPNAGNSSWVQIGASALAEFETVSSTSHTINGIAESNSLGMLAVGAADAERVGGDIVYALGRRQRQGADDRWQTEAGRCGDRDRGADASIARGAEAANRRERR